ncbi:hypothetical protein [Acidisoma cladoniae]|jgi:hypothetical protein|uniref:hypothetical protein n=1 Tax=Acidisoma cladoniae TaxID=3040935 RepID=UPI00254DFBC7|nr:hypothetical protein [Acidisoma sp. PAMC 29798]
MQEIAEHTPNFTMTDADFASYIAAIATAEPWLLVSDKWEIDDEPDDIELD